MFERIDIQEDEVLIKYPGILQVLLYDYNSKKNIIWATKNYEHLGKLYDFLSEIKSDLIVNENGNIIKPRVSKNRLLQKFRSKEKGEVYTPLWICNKQINLIDNAWFGRENVFSMSKRGHSWNVQKEKITFPKTKSWKDYIIENRMEITCGEAPYIVSRYDTTTGAYIPIENRIGLLDRKLRVVNENVDTPEDWLYFSKLAFKSIYAFEWQGDSLFLARESMLISFIEYHIHKFEKEPLHEDILEVAEIISWNVWQMDGIKGVIPNSCFETYSRNLNLFGEVESKKTVCQGCEKNDVFKHNGVYCFIKDWHYKNENNGEIGRLIRFVDFIV